jgi:CheY-like chemotaxis protein
MTSTHKARPSVLVVDDLRANLIAMRAALAPLSVEVVDADGGEDALRLVGEQPFALALIDVHMPVMDGFELAARLREIPGGDELPIIFVSAASRDERYVQHGIAAGAIDYLTKPLDVDVLRTHVRTFAERFAERA